MPEAAKANTPAGAEAFLRYFNDEYARAWMEPNDTILPGLCLPTAKACTTWQEAAATFVNDEQHFAGPPLTIKTLKASGTGTSGSLRFEMHGTQNAVDMLTSNGTKIRTVPQADASFVYYLQWTDGTWKVEQILEGAKQ